MNEHQGADGGPVQVQPVASPMAPAEVGAAVRKLLADAEVALGLPAGTGDDAARLRAIVTSGKPLPPALYACLAVPPSASEDD